VHHLPVRRLLRLLLLLLLRRQGGRRSVGVGRNLPAVPRPVLRAQRPEGHGARRLGRLGLGREVELDEGHQRQQANEDAVPPERQQGGREIGGGVVPPAPAFVRLLW